MLVENETKGEFAIRAVFWTHLSRAHAEQAAKGWSNDRLLTFSNGTTNGYVWVLRWDDKANATEFTDAIRTYFDQRATRIETGWHDDGRIRFRVTSTSPDTVVVTIGNGTFGSAVTVAEMNRTVSIGVNATRD